MHGPRLAIKQTIHPVRGRPVLLGPFALPRRQIKCCLVRMRFRGESTSSAWMEKCLARSARQENMADNDLESGTDGESNSRDKRIPKANAVYVFGARADDEFPAGFVSGEKALENGSANVRGGPDLRWSWSSLGDRRRLNKAANKPAPEPSGSDLLDRRIRIPIDRHRDGKQIGFVRDAEMLETLAHIPRAGRRLPVELFLGEFSDQLPGGMVVGVQVRSQADGPSGARPFLWYGHNADHS